MKSALHHSVILCKDVPVTILTVTAKRQHFDKVAKIKTCIYRGCKIMEHDIKLVQNSFPEHYEFVKGRNNKQQTKYNYKKKW